MSIGDEEKKKCDCDILLATQGACLTWLAPELNLLNGKCKYFKIQMSRDLVVYPYIQ
jgi:hypothetical protein